MPITRCRMPLSPPEMRRVCAVSRAHRSYISKRTMSTTLLTRTSDSGLGHIPVCLLTPSCPPSLALSLSPTQERDDDMHWIIFLQVLAGSRSKREAEEGMKCACQARLPCRIARLPSLRTHAAQAIGMQQQQLRRLLSLHLFFLPSTPLRHDMICPLSCYRKMQESHLAAGDYPLATAGCQDTATACGAKTPRGLFRVAGMVWLTNM